VHCEDGDQIEKLQKGFIAEGLIAPVYHAVSRPPETEYDSVKQVLSLAQKAKCKVYIVHVSTEGSVKLIKSAQQSGQKVFAETCPQYLFLDDSLYHLPGFESAKYVMSPPLRSKENAKALRKALENGVFNVISTDHCPFNFKGQKDAGKKDFRRIPNGVGGIEHRLSLLYNFGVIKEKISLNKFVEFTSTQAAKIFGLYPRKGEIAVGSDADLLIWNPKVKKVISYKTHHQRCDYNIYEGFKTIGAPEIVIVAGKIAYASDKIKTEGLKGKYLKRKT
jgi:dihydropyrimidinase